MWVIIWEILVMLCITLFISSHSRPKFWFWLRYLYVIFCFYLYPWYPWYLFIHFNLLFPSLNTVLEFWQYQPTGTVLWHADCISLLIKPLQSRFLWRTEKCNPFISFHIICSFTASLHPRLLHGATSCQKLKHSKHDETLIHPHSLNQVHGLTKTNRSQVWYFGTHHSHLQIGPLRDRQGWRNVVQMWLHADHVQSKREYAISMD